MTSAPGQPPADRPLTEDQILDLVEGRLTGAEADSVLSRSGRAGLADRVRQMQSHRRVLQNLPLEPAPRHLAERVIATLERDALLGLAKGEPVEDHIPIHTGDRTRQAGHRPWMRAAPGLALAAGLVLLVGGGAYWSSLLIGGKDKPAPIVTPGPMAMKTSEGMAAPVADVAVNETAAPASATLASADAASRAEAAPASVALSSEAAAKLAQEGRLVIRVAASSTRSIGQLEAMGNGRNHRAWRLRKDVPAEVSSAILAVVAAAPVHPDFVGPVMAASEPERFGSIIAPLVGPRAALNIVPPRIERAGAAIAGSYLLELPADAASVESITTLLSDRLKGEVRLEELPESVDAPLADDAESLTWWTQPPQQWAPRVTVPLVIEERE
ncbi:MAG: hypothetical protein DYG92_03765 [Leptolyngbya sp. PLA1]|nr:hypothetical protein [Leptolyngbya sp. PLA1]